MPRIERFDVCRNGSSPICYDAASTTRATRFVGEFPRKDRWRDLVSIYNKADPGFVGGLGFRVCVEVRCSRAKSGVVSWFAAEIAPVVEKRHDQFDAFGFSGGDDVVKDWDAGGRIEIEVLTRAVQDLKVYLGGAGCGIVSFAEAPDAGDFDLRLVT